MEKKRRNDVLLVAVIVAAAAAALILWLILRQEGVMVRVSVDGKEIAAYPLSQNIEVAIDELGHNTLVIQDGYAYILDADCPDQQCVQQGKISRGGQSIICLPNKLVIEIEGGENTVDGVSQ